MQNDENVYIHSTLVVGCPSLICENFKSLRKVLLNHTESIKI